MSRKDKEWTGDDVRRRLASVDLGDVWTEEESTISGYHLAASVLSSFDPDSLEPVGGADEDAFTQLLADSIVMPRTDGSSAWSLRPVVRTRSLRQLAKRGMFLEAITANKRPGQVDSLQEMFEMYFKNSAPALKKQTLEQLSASLQIARLLDDGEIRESVRDEVRRALPKATELRDQIALARLLKPFRDLVGNHFRGRVTELVTLSDYVEFFAASSMLESVRRVGRDFFSLKEKPPLLVTGPGGVGKSTLIAKFILDHLDASLGREDEARLVFAYLDLDRPDLSADKPVTLLAGMLQQLGTIFPRVRNQCEEMMEQLHRSWDRKGETESSQGMEMSAATIDGFLNIFNKATAGSNVPVFLVVFDNFEEVQYRSHEDVEQLWSFLNQLQGRIPKLRTVLAGRSPLKGFDVQTLEIPDFNKEATVAYLTVRGIEDPEVAKEIAERIGGNPLSLCLAVELVRKEGVSSIKDVNLRRFFLFKLSNVLIQGQLYQRILEHLHSPKIRNLAHPGLVLRRVTPEIILRVLAGPCGVEVRDIQEATDLFLELKREASLVRDTRDAPPDEALEVRPDLRRMMLQQLASDEPVKVRSIHESAVEFYSQRDDIISRSEQIYHRLALGQTDERVARLFVKGVEDRLRSAVQELPRASQPFLASRVGAEIDAEIWKEADLESWEIQAAARIERLLASNRFSDAMKVLSERKERTDRSPLFRLEALVYERAGNSAESPQREDLLAQARSAISRALPSWTAQDINDEQFLDKLVIAARLDLSLATTVPPDDLFQEFEAVCRKNPGDPRLLRLGLHRLKLLETMGERANGPSYLLRNQLVRLVPGLSTDKISLDPTVYFDFGAEFASLVPEVVINLVRSMSISKIFSKERWEEIQKLAAKTIPWIANREALRLIETATGSRLPAWADILVLQVFQQIKRPASDVPLISPSLLEVQTEPVTMPKSFGRREIVALDVFEEGSITEAPLETKKPKRK